MVALIYNLSLDDNASIFSKKECIKKTIKLFLPVHFVAVCCDITLLSGLQRESNTLSYTTCQLAPATLVQPTQLLYLYVQV